jgi:hypothetical protein
MGVDIYGRKPKIEVERLGQIAYQSLTDDEKQEYLNKVEECEEKSPGNYFHSNWWGWRPIHMLCEVVNDKYNLKMDMSYWGSNEGKGLRTQKQCDRLADALELILNDNFPKDFMEDDSNVIQVAMGSWDVTGTGEVFFGEEDELNGQYEKDTILWAPVLTKKGVLAETTYSCSLEDIKEWINFLRECGGFKIW